MVRRSQRKVAFESLGSSQRDSIDLGSDSDIEIIDSGEQLETSRTPSPPAKKQLGQSQGKHGFPVKKDDSILEASRTKSHAEARNLSNKVSELEQKQSDEEDDIKSNTEDSDGDISIVQVVEVPSESKFLRKRSKKQDSTKQAKHKPAEVPVEFSDLEDTAADSSAFYDAILEPHSPGLAEPHPLETAEPHLLETAEPPVLETAERQSVIEIESGSEDELVLAPASQFPSSARRSRIRLLYNPSYNLVDKPHNDTVNLDTVTIHELVGTSDLQESFQFNFSIDLEFFLTYLHPEFSKNQRKITFISGNAHLAGHPLRKQIESKFNISELVAPLPNRFASHHSKMMINFFLDDTFEVVIMSCNLTQLDFGGLTQAVWRSGKLARGGTKANVGKRFKRDLVGYLHKYGLVRIDKLAEKLSNYNFDPVDVELIASAPGIYDVNKVEAKDEAYGFGKLRQVLHRNDLLIRSSKKSHNILAQVTSIAYPFASRKGDTSSVFSHILCPLMFSSWSQLEPGSTPSKEHQEEFNYKPHIVYPTAKEVASSNFGYLSGSAVHFKYSGSLIHEKQYTQNVKPYLRKWSSVPGQTGRESVTPHVKYYACDNGDDWKTLKWVLMGSHNLSKQAWGYPQSKTLGQTYEVASYELSVLVVGSKKGLVPVYKQDFSSDPNSNPIRFPFQLPPAKYGAQDKPWSASEDYGLMKDRWGNLHHGGNFSA